VRYILAAVTTFAGDLRYALRRWRHRPGLPIAAILMLGLGIASATATFSVVDAVLLKPLPWTKPESLVVVHGVYPGRRANPATAPTWNRWLLSYPALDALRASSGFEMVGAWHYAPAPDMTFGDDRTEIITPLEVSSTFLPMLGVGLSWGRYFNDAEDNERSDSLILTHETWQRRFAGRDVVGEHLTLGSATYGDVYSKTIVGVIAPGFQFAGVQPDVLLPIGRFSAFRSQPARWFRVVARLASGVSLSTAESQAAALVSAAPSEEPGSARLVPIEDEHVGPSKRPLWLLLGGAGILLLIACSNVAGLLLGEARVRRHEFAVRAALGGSGGQVLRQLIVEHGMLAIGGSAVGLLVAYWVIAGLVAIAPAEMPRIETATIDVRATLFAMASGLLTLLAFGVAPALAIARAPVSSVLAEGGRGGSASRLVGQRLIVVAQVALALVLLTGATLFAETILRLQAQPLGFRPDGLAVVSTTFTGNLYGDSAAVKAAFSAAGPKADTGSVMSRLGRAVTMPRTEAVLERLRVIPGVTRADASSGVPFVAAPRRDEIVLEGQLDTAPYDVLRQVVTEGYFATLGISLMSGRSFEPGDVVGPYVAVVSAEFERRFFPGGATGRRFGVGGRYDPRNAFRIVGVVADVRRQEPTDDARPVFYWDYRQGSTPNHFVIRSAGDPSDLLPAVRRAIGEVSPQLVVTSMTTMASSVAQSVVEERFRATLSVLFGAAAVLLAAIGLHGLAARRVADRYREFGVRVALGAGPADVRRLVIEDAIRIVSVGFAVGLPSSYIVAQIARSLLFGVTPTSPHVFAITVALLAVVVTAATIVPARRAARVDPVVALKQ
jgi:ABC-type lipoprotein release transport system permease subunit